MAERRPFKPRGAGSIPVAPIYLVPRFDCLNKVAGPLTLSPVLVTGGLVAQ